MRNLSLLTATVLLAGFLSLGCERTTAPTPRANRAPQAQPATPEANPDDIVMTASATGNSSSNSSSSDGAASSSATPASAAPPITQIISPTEDGKLPALTWDLAEDRSPAKIGWPKDQGNNKVFCLEGDFQFHLKVQDKKDFEGRVRQVESRRSGGLIEAVEITSHPQDTSQAYARTKTMLNSLGFGKNDLAKLDAWQTKAKAGNYDNLDLKFKNSYNRTYTVHIVNDGTSELPWSVGLDIDWSEVCSCHG